MNRELIDVINVYLELGGQKRTVGRLALKDRRILFEYSREFIETGLELSPFYLPLKSGVQVSEGLLFDGLFGVFNDSLPDGWGRLLLDRKLIAMGVNPGSLSPLDRLSYVGSRGMGALVYEPEMGEVGAVKQHQDLDEIAQEVYAFQANDDRYVDDLLAMNGSSAGARPKIVIDIGGEAWMVKFRSSVDSEDIGLIEYGYHLMAVEAGLEVAEARLFESRKGAGYFGVKCFDRCEGRRIHMHSMSGLLHVDYRLPNLDYEAMIKATLWLTKDVKECERQFRAAVFNVLAHNRDDHAKNFSFLMDEKGVWRVSPAYDLTFSSGPFGEHYSTVMGQGKDIKLSHLLQLASVANIKEERAMEIISEVKAGVGKWERFSKDLGIGKSMREMIQGSLDGVLRGVME